MIDFYPVSKLRNSGRHKMINVEGYSAVSDGFIADEWLVPDHGTFQRRDAHMAIRAPNVKALRSKCNFQSSIAPIARSKTSHKENRLWGDWSIIHTRDLQHDKFLTEISVSEASHCSLIDFTMHWTDGSKKEATSELRKDIVHPMSRYYAGCIPKKFQLARTNVEYGIVIADATKFDILRLICIPEPELGSLVESI